MFCKKKIIRILFAFLLFSISVFSQNNLQSGPMVGYCEMKEAMIWLQTEKPASVYVEYYSLDNPEQVLQSTTLLTKNENAFNLKVINIICFFI